MTDSIQGHTGGTVEWVSLEESLNYPKISGLIPSMRTWYWVLYKPQFKRRMVEAGAMIKVGKSWRVSVHKAPSVIEEIYREHALASLDRVSTGSSNRRPNRLTRPVESATA